MRADLRNAPILPPPMRKIPTVEIAAPSHSSGGTSSGRRNEENAATKINFIPISGVCTETSPDWIATRVNSWPRK